MERDPSTSASPNETNRFAVLLFTDIVGSTQANDRYGVDAYGAALSTHNRHFERLIGDRQGVRNLRNTGDGFFVEVASVVEAVKLALLFQEAMRTGPWGEVRLTSRVGIHAGEIRALEGGKGSEIVAPAVNIASRVMSLAVGGQILLTRFPFDNARPFLREHPTVAGKTMPSLRWLAYGSYRLKGINEPVEIFEVGSEGLAPFAAPPDGVKARRDSQTGSGDNRTDRLNTSVPPALERSLSRDFLLGFGALFAVFLLKIGFDQTRWGIKTDGWVSAQLQGALSTSARARASEIQVVDISAIKGQPVVEYPPFPGETEPRNATPREKLLEIVGTMVELKPRAIGIDIDFSAWEDGRPVTPKDAEFFAQILDMSEQHRVPIYLGVSRQRWGDAALWLGNEKFQKLAAGLEVPEEPETRFYVRWLRGTNAPTALPNFSITLIGRAEEAGSDDRQGSWDWAFRSAKMRSAPPAYWGQPSPGRMSWALVDYSPLESLEKGALSVERAGTITDNKLKFRDRMILVGDVTNPQYHDHFNIGDLRPRGVAGIFLHGCAALTALGRPLLELTLAGRLVVFLSLASTIMGGIAAIRFIYGRHRATREKSIPWKYTTVTGVAILASWLGAGLFVSSSRIIWTDFTAITLGLVLHLYLRQRFPRLHGRPDPLLNAPTHFENDSPSS